MKKILSLFLAFAMVLCMVPTVAMAEGSSLKMSEKTIDGKKGFEITYTIPNSVSVNGVELKISFDNTKVEVKSVTWNEEFGLGEGTYNDDLTAVNTSGYIACSWSTARDKTTSADLKLVTATFVMKDGASGDIVFNTDDIVITDSDTVSKVTEAGATKNQVKYTVPKPAITSINVKVDAPVKGEALATTGTVPADAEYEIKSVKWYKADGETEATGNAEASTVYSVEIIVEAKSGSTFAAKENLTSVDPTYAITKLDGYTKVTLVKTFSKTDDKPALTGTVKIDGVQEVGEALTAKTEGLNTTEENLTFTWYRGTTEVGTGKEYTVAKEDYNQTLKLVVTAKETSDFTGSLEASTGTIGCDHDRGANGVCTKCGAGCPHASGTSTAAKNATCTENGNKAYWTCTACGKMFTDATHTTEITDVTIPAIKHNFTTVVEQPATCTAEGRAAYRTCSNSCCTNKKFAMNSEAEVTDAELVLSATGHATLKEFKAVAATCKNEGRIGYWYCEKCNAKFQTNNVSAPLPEDTKMTTDVNPENHETALGKHDRVEPTCSKTGTIEYWHCNSCGNNYNNVNGTGTALTEKNLKIDIDSRAHKNIVAVDAKPHTCTEDGYKAHYKCADCNNALFSDAAGTQPTDADKIKDPAAHTLELVPAVDSTCIVKGHDAYYKCKVCGKMFADNAAATPLTAVPEKPLAAHTAYSSAAHASDATNHWKLCQWCGIKVNSEAHAWNTPAAGEATVCTVCGYVKEKAATPCATGQHDTVFVYDENNHYHVCKKCGEVDGTKGEHSFIESATKAATATEDGWKTELCKECGYVKTTVLPKTGTTTPGGNGGTGGGFPFKDSNKTNNTGKVESQKTFDGGIALYVGLSVLSLTGSALVIRKKKEF